jgi:glycosyltransferase involved in cell wall biosynthesis
MISAIVPTLNAQAELPRCFDSLIPAALSGLVREVIVADGGSTDDTLFIADGAGAHIVQAGKLRSAQLAAGARQAKCDWLLFLQPQTVLEPGWQSEVESFLDRHELERPHAAVFRFALDQFGTMARAREMASALRFFFLRLPGGDQGLLMSRRLYQQIGGYRELGALEDIDIVRRIGRRRLVMLRARAISSSTRFRRAGISALVLSVMKVPTRLLARIYR